MTDSDDILERSKELDRQILAIPAEKVFTKKAVTIFGTTIVVLQLVLMAMVLNVTRSTNQAVRDEIPSLKRTIERQDVTIVEQQEVLTEAVDWIIKLQDQIRLLGGTPPEIVLRPGD